MVAAANNFLLYCSKLIKELLINLNWLFGFLWSSLLICFIFPSSNALCLLMLCLLLHPQVWAEPWRVSVYAPVLPGLPRTWAGAAVTEVALVEAVPPARGRCAAAGATGSKTSTWTLSSQRRWHCIWTLQAPPLLEGEEPGNETPPSVVMSSQTPLHTNATGWSDLLPAYVCEGVGGKPSKPRLGEGDGWAYVGQMRRWTDRRSDAWLCWRTRAENENRNWSSRFGLFRCWMNSIHCLLSLHDYYKSLICNQNTWRTCVTVTGRSGRHHTLLRHRRLGKETTKEVANSSLGCRQFSKGWKCTVLLDK